MPIRLVYLPVTDAGLAVASASETGHAGHPADQHLLVDVDSTDKVQGPAPDVVVCRTAEPADHGERVSDIYRHTPGCLVAAVPWSVRSDAWVVDVRQHAAITVWPENDGTRIGADASLCASIIHTWTVLGRPLTELEHGRLRVRTPGGSTRSLRLTHSSIGNM